MIYNYIKKKKKTLLTIFLVFSLIIIAILDVSLGRKLSLAKFLPHQLKLFLKETIFLPFEKLSAHDEMINDLNEMKGLNATIKNIHSERSVINSLNNFNLSLKKIKLNIDGYVPGEREKPFGYIDFIDKNLILVTSYGDIFQVPKEELSENYGQKNYHEIKVKNPIFKKELDYRKNLKLIKNNLKKNYLLDRNYEKNKDDVFWGNSYFNRSPKSITDIKAANGYLYVSFIAEITNRCFNVNVVRSKIDNYANEMIFENFFFANNLYLY